ncbi:MAG: nucleoside deaminase [Rickettsiales bacterium]|jgi:tRNA(adenine34) deaminase|nr:nucleoside deaminase [Rickettsiales bacterium]
MDKFIKESLRLARHASAHGDVPVGAVIVQNGKIIARAGNQVQQKKNPTLHAEIVAINRACKKLGKKFLDDCEIYVSLEPCAMCATAISFARIKRIIFVAADEKGGGIMHGARVYETQKNLYKPDVVFVEKIADESKKLLQDFFKRLRNAPSSVAAV